MALLNISSLQAETMNGIKYLVSFKTKRSACMVRVNGFPVFDNFTYQSGTIAAGDNITSFIENGKNRVEVLMGSIDSKNKDTLYPDSECEFTITRDTIDTSEEVTTIKLSVDKDKNIVATSSSSYDGFKQEGRIADEQLPEDNLLYLHRFYREIEFSGIKEWSWVNADRTVTEKDLPAIQETYREIWQAIKNRDIGRFKTMAAISSQEMGDAEGISSDLVFESYDLPKTILSPNLTPVELKWSEYKLTTYCGGRVFRLSSGVYQNSPLRLANKNGEIEFSYNPYLSIINGNIVIVR
ncbi:hypothetical protein [Atlantibacter subterraneus]|uniref:hypothetical protein n=1 Tax=Atlantibacter subterraneus TaxID=255519 RepID=UPI0029651633|nr:hypothetical protein [Atlantibacter subterranea]MDW2741685.1 hypothetical protein [Atlantibacter subterranea]